MRSWDELYAEAQAEVKHSIENDEDRFDPDPPEVRARTRARHKLRREVTWSAFTALQEGDLATAQATALVALALNTQYIEESIGDIPLHLP